MPILTDETRAVSRLEALRLAVALTAANHPPTSIEVIFEMADRFYTYITGDLPRYVP